MVEEDQVELVYHLVYLVLRLVMLVVEVEEQNEV